MGDLTTVEMIRGLYDYHRWANRRLFDVAVALGEDVTTRDLGKAFSFPTIKAMFAHIYGADFLWFQCCTALTPVRRLRDADFPTLAAVRAPWDEFENEQTAFIEALTPADLGRTVEFVSVAYPRPDGRPYQLPLWSALQHVANHATHHRSEIATMITMVSGSPPGTDLVVRYFRAQGFPG
jgi:uncharacterized damage-inducible protein DinB